MLLINIFAILVAFAIITQAKYDFCSENFSVSDLPQGIMREINGFVINGTLNYFFGCHDVPAIEAKYVQVYLYNRKHKNNPILLNSKNIKKINMTKPTKLLIHGWLCNISNDRIPELKNSYLERYDCNVMALEWSPYALDLYANAYCYVPKIAKQLAKFLCDLGIDFKLIHAIGHSLGAQLSGLLGQEVKEQCGKTIERITGLDPAGPLYIGLEKDRRLDASDAKFVDVIHVNGGFFGYLPPCGSVDFYPNCGIIQPGCMHPNTSLTSDPIDLIYYQIACSHLRAPDLMIASINGFPFYARQCDIYCPLILKWKICADGKVALMGEDSPVDKISGNYYLDTHSKYPWTNVLGLI